MLLSIDNEGIRHAPVSDKFVPFGPIIYRLLAQFLVVKMFLTLPYYLPNNIVSSRHQWLLAPCRDREVNISCENKFQQTFFTMVSLGL